MKIWTLIPMASAAVLVIATAYAATFSEPLSAQPEEGTSCHLKAGEWKVLYSAANEKAVQLAPFFMMVAFGLMAMAGASKGA